MIQIVDLNIASSSPCMYICMYVCMLTPQALPTLMALRKPWFFCRSKTKASVSSMSTQLELKLSRKLAWRNIRESRVFSSGTFPPTAAVMRDTTATGSIVESRPNMIQLQIKLSHACIHVQILKLKVLLVGGIVDAYIHISI